MANPMKAILELPDLLFFLRLLIFNVVWIDYETVDVFLNLTCMMLCKDKRVGLKCDQIKNCQTKHQADRKRDIPCKPTCIPSPRSWRRAQNCSPYRRSLHAALWHFLLLHQDLSASSIDCRRDPPRSSAIAEPWHCHSPLLSHSHRFMKNFRRCSPPRRALESSPMFLLDRFNQRIRYSIASMSQTFCIIYTLINLLWSRSLTDLFFSAETSPPDCFTIVLNILIFEFKLDNPIIILLIKFIY